MSGQPCSKAAASLPTRNPEEPDFTLLDCKTIAGELVSPCSGRFSPHFVEDLAQSIAHPETLYIGIDMRQPRRTIRKAVEQAIRKWQPVYRAVRRRRPHGRFENYRLYMQVYDLRIQEGRTWAEIGARIYPDDQNPDPENQRRKAMNYFEQAKEAHRRRARRSSSGGAVGRVLRLCRYRAPRGGRFAGRTSPAPVRRMRPMDHQPPHGDADSAS